MLLIAGLIFLVLGLFSGIVLTLSPMGWMSLEPGWVLWAAFPLFSVLGYILCAIPAKLPVIRGITLTASSLMLIMALFSAAMLVLLAASVLTESNGTASLWYVLAVGGVLGISGTLPGRGTTPSQ